MSYACLAADMEWFLQHSSYQHGYTATAQEHRRGEVLVIVVCDLGGQLDESNTILVLSEEVDALDVDAPELVRCVVERMGLVFLLPQGVSQRADPVFEGREG